MISAPGFLPCAADAAGGEDLPSYETFAFHPDAAAVRFLYSGLALTPGAFVEYARAYDWGPLPGYELPNQLVIHNTANPCTRAARLPGAAIWDDNEIGLTSAEVIHKRGRQLAGIKNFYIGLGWDRGPHLFVDGTWIWLFSPLNRPAIHAKEGNSYRAASGKIIYTISVEVLGWFGKVRWSEPICQNLRVVAQTLRHVLGFEIIYRRAPIHQPQAHARSIAFHFDYNKQECPGQLITPGFAIGVLAQTIPPGQIGGPMPTKPLPPPPPPAQPSGTFPVDARFSHAWTESGGLYIPGRLTPGYARSPAELLADGSWRQRFERGVCRLTPTGEIQWFLLDEIAQLPPVK